MAKLFDAEGKEIEALTPEEFEAKKAEIVKEATSGFEAKNAETQKQIEDLTKKLEEAGLSDAQKKRLKEDKEAAEVLLKQVREESDKKIDELRTQIFGGQRTKLVNGLAKDDETRQKINAKVEVLMKTGEYANDEEGIRRAVTDAATIITGARPAPGFMDGISGAGDRGDGHSGKSNGVETDGSKALRKAMGISDEEAKKFAPTEEKK